MNPTASTEAALWQQDFDLATALAGRADRSDDDVTTLARLLLRYQRQTPQRDNPIRALLIRAAQARGFSGSAELNAASRAIWERGYRPMPARGAEVGSGADVGAAE